MDTIAVLKEALQGIAGIDPDVPESAGGLYFELSQAINLAREALQAVSSEENDDMGKKQNYRFQFDVEAEPKQADNLLSAIIAIVEAMGKRMFGGISLVKEGTNEQENSGSVPER